MSYSEQSQRAFRAELRAARKNLADISSMTSRTKELLQFPAQQPTNVEGDDGLQECEGCNERDITIQDLNTLILLLNEQNAISHEIGRNETFLERVRDK